MTKYANLWTDIPYQDPAGLGRPILVCYRRPFDDEVFLLACGKIAKMQKVIKQMSR